MSRSAVLALGLLAVSGAFAAPPDCTPVDCGYYADPSNFSDDHPKACGVSAPYICRGDGGGCYTDTTVKNCPSVSSGPNPAGVQGACSFAPCSKVSNRPTRIVEFQNWCSAQGAFAVYQDESELIPAAQFPVGAKVSQKVSLKSGVNAFQQTYYYSGAGINFRALPPDLDLSNSTLFEVNFGAYAGAADVYDVSAIPPGSCAAHNLPSEPNYGYADHLPYKDPNDPAQNWACLPLADTGKPDPKTCGDGLGWMLCPAVSGVTTAPLTASKTGGPGGGVRYGSGVPGEQCCAKDSDPGKCKTPAQPTTCIPAVCAFNTGDDPTSAVVRNRLRSCSYQQGVAAAKQNGTLVGPPNKLTPPRQTGFWVPVKAEPVWDLQSPPLTPNPACKSLTCSDGSGSDPFADMATTCADGYLWPYDDHAALITCAAAPDYRVIFCPAEAP